MMSTSMQGRGVQDALSAASDALTWDRTTVLHTALQALDFLGESANLSRAGQGISPGGPGPSALRSNATFSDVVMNLERKHMETR